MKLTPTAICAVKSGYDSHRNLPVALRDHATPLRSAMVKKVQVEPSAMGGDVFPYGGGHGWDRDNYGPIYIPRKGSKLKLIEWNFPIYERIIRVYEKNTLVKKDGKYSLTAVRNYRI